MKSGCCSFLRASLLVACAALFFGSLSIQSLGQAAPAGMMGPPLSRVDIYGGVGYFHPFNSDINLIKYETSNYGAVASVTGYFNRYLGLQVEGSYFEKGPSDNDCVYTGQAGPILRYQRGRFVPFFHVLGGAAEIGGPAKQPCSVWGWGITGGGGLDYILPMLGDHLAIRPIQADFTYSHIDNGPLIYPAGVTGGLGEIYAYRLSGGFVLRFGNLHPAPPTTLACSSNPAEVYAGDPITVSANALNLATDKRIEYLWTSSNEKVKISGTDATETIDTAGLDPGGYNVAAKLVQGRKGSQVAACTADFKILDTDPPVVTCAADRAAINSGDPVVITTTARSPQNLILTYDYSTSNGQIAGAGSTANLTTVGATPGAITVTCKVTDSKGKTTNATASVVVATPVPPPPAPAAHALCAVSFERDRQRPNRVDNEAKGCLDDVALTLNRETGSKLLIIGNHDSNEPPQDAAARALNVSEYLVKEKGIDPARLDLRVGDTSARTVTNTLVPAGAVLDAGSAVTFDSNSIRRHGQPYGMPGTATHRRRPKKTAAPEAP